LPFQGGNECYVKIELPQKFDFKNFNPDGIEATGMFIDAEGNPTTSVFKHNLDDATSETKWIIIQGCKFNPVDKTPEQLSLYLQNKFMVKLPGLTNPWTVLARPLSISIFNSEEALSDLLLASSDLSIPASSFEFTLQPIEDVSVASSSGVLGAESTLTLSFTPKVKMPNGGSVVVEVPKWAQIYSDIGELVAYYAFEASLKCTVQSLSGLNVELVEKLAKFKYSEYTGQLFEPITIVCQGFKNPIVPEVQGGW
jgi:hypothetical protein